MERQIFSANLITDKIKWDNTTRGTWHKENHRYKYIARKTENIPWVKTGSEIKPRLGQGRVGIKCKKPQTIKNMDELTDKLQEILKIPATQNIAKIEWTFQCMSNQ